MSSQIQILLLLSMFIYFTACTKNREQKDVSLAQEGEEKLVHYLSTHNEEEPALELKDYIQSGITGIDISNIKSINEKMFKIKTGKTTPNIVVLPNGKKDLIYRYDPNQNYQYDFNNSNANRIKVTLKNGKIDLSKIVLEENQTTFLKMDIWATKIGNYFSPSVTLTYSGVASTQTVEEHASGIRYFNISDMPFSQKRQLMVVGNFLSIPDQTVELIQFHNDDLSQSKILLISPHPDDAEIAAYGLYSKYHKNMYIVTITAGDAYAGSFYKRFYSDLEEQCLAKGKKRTWESINIPALAGVTSEKCVNLGYLDGQLYTMYHHPSANVSSHCLDASKIKVFRGLNRSELAQKLKGNSSWNSLVDNLYSLIKAIKPDIIVAPYPLIDKHTDHQLSSKALFRAIKKLKMKKGKLYLYTNHLLQSEYYPFGEKGELITLPPIFNKKLYINSIYSHALSLKEQSDKLFALEAMSDLRYSDSPFESVCKVKSTMLCQDFSYFRRAVRSNELFFVIDIENIYENTLFN